MALVCVLTFLIFASGRRLQQLVGNVGLSIATRILGLLVASMGAQFILTGVSNVIVNTIAPEIIKQL